MKLILSLFLFQLPAAFALKLQEEVMTNLLTKREEVGACCAGGITPHCANSGYCTNICGGAHCKAPWCKTGGYCVKAPAPTPAPTVPPTPAPTPAPSNVVFRFVINKLDLDQMTAAQKTDLEDNLDFLFGEAAGHDDMALVVVTLKAPGASFLETGLTSGVVVDVTIEVDDTVTMAAIKEGVGSITTANIEDEVNKVTGISDAFVGTMSVSKVRFVSDTAGGFGDPHLRNMNGERFNLHKTGSVPLLKIPAGGKQLKIMGNIEAARQCSKITFITQLNLTGTWLEKKIDVAVNPNEIESSTFFLAVDGEQIWTHSKDGEARFTGGNEGNILKHDGKFSVRQLNTIETGETKPGVQFQFANAPSLFVTVTYPRAKASTRPHLNLDVKGLQSPGIVSVGGILGTDEHSEYEMKPEGCQQESFARSFANHLETAEQGSTAEAW